MQSSAVASVAREMESSRTDKSGGVLASTDEGKETQRNGEATGGSEVLLEPYRTLCPHYTRGCSFVSPCCGKVYLCRLCHNEQEHTHEIDRYKISEVVCRNCATRQPVAADCTKCGIRFGRYFCAVCRLYDDTDKKQFHCEKCGLCRIGGRENFFHCDTCGYCLATSMKNSHLCRRQASRDNCPVCMEDLHTSRNQMHVPDCGHLLHGPCFRQMLQKGLYQCPQCQKSLTDMSEAWKIRDEERRVWPMPLHLRNFRVKIQCRDCRQESETDFHMVGFKCGNCGSYNTVRCGNEELPEDNGERGEGEGGEAGGEGGRGRGGGVMQMVDALIQIARLRQQLRRVREGEREAEEEEQGEGEEEGEGEGEGEGEIGVGLIERILSLSDSSEEGEEEEEEEEEEEDEEEDEEEEGEEEEEEEEDSDERDSPPQPFPPDNESYDGDESEAESVGSHDDTHLPGAHGLAQPAARGRDWYQHESSSEPEWPMTLPVALDMSDWSDSFTQSDLRSLASNSSWETEEEEVIIGGAPHDLEANETRGEETQENWETGDNEGVETATGTTATVLPLTTYGLQVSRNLNAYDAHIRLDQNGTSEDSLSWETAHDDVTGDSTVPAGTTN